MKYLAVFVVGVYVGGIVGFLSGSAVPSEVPSLARDYNRAIAGWEKCAADWQASNARIDQILKDWPK